MTVLAGSSEAKRVVFVTVGTTKFDDLIRAVDNVDLANLLHRKGYTHLVIQKGNGAYLPINLVPQGASSQKLSTGLTAAYFDFAPSLADHIASAALVISHAGSGSIFETLTCGVPLIVVPNPKLMDNHQVELGNTLADMKHLVSATLNTLHEAIAGMDPSTLRPYSKGTPAGIVKAVDSLMGFA